MLLWHPFTVAIIVSAVVIFNHMASLSASL
nr:MAG TPA: hypothetical protein [Caudoviricetes sp.]